MESGNGVHVEDENGVMNVETNEIELSKLEVSKSCEDVNGTTVPNSVEVKTNEGTSKKNKVAKNGPKGSLARKPKPHITQSFPAKPRNESMKTSIDGHPGKPRGALSNGNAVNPANRRASAGVKTNETGSTKVSASTRRATLDSVPNVRMSQVNPELHFLIAFSFVLVVFIVVYLLCLFVLA